MSEDYIRTASRREISTVSNAEAKTRKRLEHCLKKAVEQCIDSQRADGSWVVTPDPRIFETALVGYALSRTPRGECADAVERARSWLSTAEPQRHSDVAFLIEDALKSIFLGRKNVIDLKSPLLRSAEFKSRMLLLYALALYSGTPVRAPIDDDMLYQLISSRFFLADKTQIKQWTKVEIASVYLLLQSRMPSRKGHESALQTILLAQEDNGGFFNNPVAGAVAYLALCEAAPMSPARQKCMEYLLGHQQSDGSWCFCTSDVWDTVLTLRSFRGHALFDAEALERGSDFLIRSQNDDDGWSFSSSVESDNDTTSAAILALKDIPEAEEGCTRALRFLADYQQPDGLWRTWKFIEDPPVEDVNAHIVAALNATRGRHHIGVGAAKRWLKNRYEKNKKWSASWYRGTPYAVAEVSEGIGVCDAHVFEAMEQLKNAQNTDGGWGPEVGRPSVPSATGLALSALLDFHSISASEHAKKGLDFLMETQQKDGLWPGIPEMYGPRPLLSHYQTHTQAFAVKGMVKALHRM